jgi:hypothetical protein
MAETLLDIIKKNQQKQQQPNVGGINPQSGLLSNLAAQSGKATTGTGTGPKLTNLSQQMANAGTQAQLGQVQQQNQLNNLGTAQAQAEQKTQFQQNQAALDLRQQQISQSFANQSASILQNLEQNRANLDQQEYANQLEQAKAATALSNQKYIANLKQSGDRLRLNNWSNFKVSSAQTAMENLMGKTLDEQEFKTLFNSDRRTFEEQLAQYSADEAWKTYTEGIQDANTRMIIESILEGGGGVQGAMSDKNAKDAKAAPGVAK